MTLARLKAARLAKAAAGGYAHGAPPYGWTGSNGSLVQVPSEQRALARMVELRRAGLSMREIAVDLDVEGQPTKRGGQWSSSTVSRILIPHRRGAEGGELTWPTFRSGPGSTASPCTS